MITLNDAAQALTQAGFTVQIDNDTDGFVELIAHKDGFCETFFDADYQGPQYLGSFKCKELLVAYAEKSIVLHKRQFS